MKAYVASISLEVGAIGCQGMDWVRDLIPFLKGHLFSLSAEPYALSKSIAI
jgi:hypothetical protein